MRLRAEIRADSSVAPASEQLDGAAVSVPLAARDGAERAWAVSAEHGVPRGPGLKGAIAYPVKLVLRPLLRWYVEPALAEQRQFNAALLLLIDELTERVNACEKSDRSE